MYGYLRIIDSHIDEQLNRFYRKQYCSLCHALWRYYGIHTRFLLSYDMAFLSIIMGLNSTLTPSGKNICLKKQYNAVQDAGWKRLAALTIILVFEKIRDDIIDEGLRTRKLLKRAFTSAYKRAGDDYPEITELCLRGFDDMVKLENMNADVEILSSAFADLMRSTLFLMGSVSEREQRVVRHVAKWCYFIDAIDDLDEDYIKNRYNPFLRYNNTRKALLHDNSLELISFCEKMMADLSFSIKDYDNKSLRDAVILCIVCNTIPTETFSIIQGKRKRNRSPFIAYMKMRRGIVLE